MWRRKMARSLQRYHLALKQKVVYPKKASLTLATQSERRLPQECDKSSKDDVQQNECIVLTVIRVTIQE